MTFQNPELTPCLHPPGGAGGRLREVRGLFVLTFQTLLQHIPCVTKHKPLSTCDPV
jgi:hypothetical protein